MMSGNAKMVDVMSGPTTSVKLPRFAAVSAKFGGGD